MANAENLCLWETACLWASIFVPPLVTFSAPCCAPLHIDLAMWSHVQMLMWRPKYAAGMRAYILYLTQRLRNIYLVFAHTWLVFASPVAVCLLISESNSIKGLAVWDVLVQ